MNSSPSESAAPPRRRGYRHYDLLMAGFVCVLLCSNLIGPGKVAVVSIFGRPLSFGAGNIFFPISYIFGDVLTEVYGYARSRRVIWAGFVAMGFATVMGWTIIHLPPDPSEGFNKLYQPAIETVFGGTWRIALGSMLAFWIGDFANSYVMARMKVLTAGRWLWMRTIGSTVVGQLVDSAVFYPIAFLGQWEPGTIVRTVAFNWVFKVMIEVVMTPATYTVVAFLKKAENEDYYDRETDFTPFSLAD